MAWLSAIGRTVRDNKAGTALAASAIVLLIVLLLAAGCSLADIVRVRAPVEVQAVVGVPPQVTLSDAGRVLAEYRAKVQAEFNARSAAGAAFAERIESGWQFVGFAQSFLQAGASEAGAAGLAALPGGALALSALTFLSGLFFKRPGTSELVRREKEESYNKGIEVGRDVAVSVANGHKPV